MNFLAKKKVVFLSVVIFLITVLLIAVGFNANVFTAQECIFVFVAGLVVEAICLYSIKIKENKQKQAAIEEKIKSEVAKFAKHINLKSNLSQERKAEIIEQLETVYPDFVAFRTAQLGITHKKLQEIYKKNPKQYVQTCAWSSMSTTNSETGYRFVLGFRNKGCIYWREAPFYIGCYNCGYCSSILPTLRPTTKDMETQFETALEDAFKSGIKFDVIEFLSDGSFFNDEEISSELRKSLMKRLSTMDNINAILVETRPEFINRDKVVELLNDLGKDKKVRIAIGLETYDDFIRNACINKGYNIAEFEDTIKCLNEFNDRIEVFVYALVKPAFINEKESIDDIIATAKELSSLLEKYDINVTLKLEPAVVSQGTILDILYFGDKEKYKTSYTLLSYWSILEILCRADIENIKVPIRIGAREDMDVVEKIPGVYNAHGRLADYDFIIYDIIQDYNINGDLAPVLLAIEDALVDTSYLGWKENLNVSTTAIEKCCEKYSAQIEDCRNNPVIKNKLRFLRDVYRALDLIEYGGESIEYAKKLYNKKDKLRNKNVKDEVTKFVQDQFDEIVEYMKVQVLDLFFEKDNARLLRINIQVKSMKQEDVVTSVWAGVPTRKYTNPNANNVVSNSYTV